VDAVAARRRVAPRPCGSIIAPPILFLILAMAPLAIVMFVLVLMSAPVAFLLVPTSTRFAAWITSAAAATEQHKNNCHQPGDE
jgi:hypothetical protein